VHDVVRKNGDILESRAQMSRRRFALSGRPQLR
jgi:hypothetical protein